VVAVDNAIEFIDALSLMKGSYAIRSKVVHGGSIDSLSKGVKDLGHNDLNALNVKLSDLYRKVMIWLSDIKFEERPYNALFGWEKLLRSTPHS